MNHVKKIGLLITILMIEQVGCASYYGSATQTQIEEPSSVRLRLTAPKEKEADNEGLSDYSYPQQTIEKSDADKFIEQSYVFPAQQAAICALFDKPFATDTTTGAPVLLGDDNQPRNWPTIDEILARVNVGQNNALQAVLQAIGIAVENARLNFAYEADESSVNAIAQSEKIIMQELATKKQTVEQTLSRQRGNLQNTEFNDDLIEKITRSLSQADVQVYSSDKTAELINKNDFKFLVNNGKNSHAAQLLFRQCYIAQQGQNLPENHKIANLLSDAKSNTQHNKDKAIIHQKLTAIARAVDLAYFIAENEYGKSWYNPTRYVPLYGTHSLLSELAEMKEKVRQDLINPKFGATQADINRQYYLDWATSIAKGIVITGAVIGTVAVGTYAYNNPDAVEHTWNKTKANVGSVGTETYNAITGAVTTVGKKVKETTTATVNTVSNAATNVSNTVGETIFSKPTLGEKITSKGGKIKKDLYKNTAQIGNGSYFESFAQEHSLAAQEPQGSSWLPSIFNSSASSALAPAKSQSPKSSAAIPFDA
jgi:hypothetical protein